VTVAKDIMEKSVVTVDPNQPLLSVYRLFADEDISGAPVIDSAGEVVGVISSRDLVRVVTQEHSEASEDLYYYSGTSSFEDSEWFSDVRGFEDRLALRTVADVMTKGVISVAADTPVAEIAEIFHKDRIHRVLVMDEKAEPTPVIGLVSVFDLVNLLR
jgi:CBS domain-containing protein